MVPRSTPSRPGSRPADAALADMTGARRQPSRPCAAPGGGLEGPGGRTDGHCRRARGTRSERPPVRRRSRHVRQSLGVTARWCSSTPSRSSRQPSGSPERDSPQSSRQRGRPVPRPSGTRSADAAGGTASISAAEDASAPRMPLHPEATCDRNSGGAELSLCRHGSGNLRQAALERRRSCHGGRISGHRGGRHRSGRRLHCRPSNRRGSNRRTRLAEAETPLRGRAELRDTDPEQPIAIARARATRRKAYSLATVTHRLERRRPGSTGLRRAAELGYARRDSRRHPRWGAVGAALVAAAFGAAVAVGFTGPTGGCGWGCVGGSGGFGGPFGGGGGFGGGVRWRCGRSRGAMGVVTYWQLQNTMTNTIRALEGGRQWPDLDPGPWASSSGEYQFVIDDAEDPEKMLDQLVRDFTNNIAEARRPSPRRSAISAVEGRRPRGS